MLQGGVILENITVSVFKKEPVTYYTIPFIRIVQNRKCVETGSGGCLAGEVGDGR